MDLVQKLFAFAVIVIGVLLVLSRLQQKLWLNLCMVPYFLHVPICAVRRIMPSLAKTFFALWVDGEVTDSHLFLYQMVATALFGVAATIFLNRQSRDAYTRVVIFFNLFLHSALFAVASFMLPEPPVDKEGNTVGSSLIYKELLYYKFPGLAIVHAFTILLAKEYFGHSELKSRLNMHLKIDFLVNLIFGIVVFAYPQQCIGFLIGGKNFDEVHIILAQVYASLVIGSAILSLFYTNVLLAINKRYLLMSRVVETLTMIILIMYTGFTSDTLGGSVQLTLLAYVVISFNALLGCYSPHETDSYVSKDD